MKMKKDKNKHGSRVDALPVLYKRRVESAGEPESVSHRQHPQDGQLIQHLAEETKCHVEVCREESCKNKNDNIETKEGVRGDMNHVNATKTDYCF